MMVNFSYIDPSIKKTTEQTKPLKEPQISKAPFALMSIFNTNSDQTIFQTPSPGPFHGTILDFQPPSMSSRASVRIQDILSTGTTEVGGTECRDQDAFKRQDNESYYFLKPGAFHECNEKWYSSNKNSAGDRQDRVGKCVDCLDDSSTNSLTPTIIHPSTASPATLNGMVPSIFSANFSSKDGLETLRCGESLEKAPEDRLDDGDNNAKCHGSHNNEATARESQTAQQDIIATQVICSSTDMGIYDPISGHQSEQLEASTTASKDHVQDPRQDQKPLDRNSHDEVMDSKNSPKEKGSKPSEELCMDNTRIPNPGDGESAVCHNSNLVPANIQGGTLACIPTSGQHFAPHSQTDGIAKRRPTRSCVAQKQKSTLSRYFQVTKRTSVQKRTPMVKFTRDEYERVRQWREDCKTPWRKILQQCAVDFPQWEQASIKQRYFATRYMNHPVQSILAKKMGRYLILWAEDNSTSWEPRKNIPSLLIREFEKNHQELMKGECPGVSED